MPHSISEILLKTKEGVLDKISAANLLISMLEVEIDYNRRVDIINALDSIGDKNHYKEIENILISEDNENTRFAAIENLLKNYKDKSQDPLLWVLKNEISYKCRIDSIKGLQRIDSEKVSKAFLDLINQIQPRSYKKDIKKFLKKNKDITINKLGDILINYLTIANLRTQFDWFNYKLDDGLIIELDLTDVEFKIRWDIWENNIDDIEDIEGLDYLTNLKCLKLANNNIREIRGLNNLLKLEELDLSNNRIKEIKGLDKLKNLKRLNLARNEISEVKNIENLQNLEVLNMRFNRIHGQDEFEDHFLWKST